MNSMTSFGQVAVFSLFLCASTLAGRGRRDRCEDIAPFCANLTKGYTQMKLPNFLGHDMPADVTKGLLNWSPLVGSSAGKFKCPEKLLKMFLCSIYAPVCVESNTEMKIEPCRSLCVKARDNCNPVMMKRSGGNITWPSTNNPAFNCSTYRDSSMCIGEIRKRELHFVFGNVSYNPDCDVCTACFAAEAMDPVVLCSKDLAIDELQREVCGSDFVLKVEYIRHKTDSSLVLRASTVKGSLDKNHKKLVNTKDGGKKRTLRLFFPGKSGDQCEHLFPLSKSMSKSSKSHPYYYFVAGKYEDGGRKGKKKMILTAVLKWKKSYKRLLRKSSCSQH